MQVDLPFLRSSPAADVQFVRQPRARRYIIRVRPDGSLRVTIPRGGSRREAEAFVATHREWADKQRVRVATQYAPVEWYAGNTIPLRGAPTPLVVEHDADGRVLVLDGERVKVIGSDENLRPAAENALHRIAERELLPRLYALAARHRLTVTRATIRNQRSRWGSCARTGAIALNFRLVQMPPSVCEYVLLHELMHLRQQDHSPRYWRLVEDVCPDFRDSERWLRREGRSLF